MFRRDFLRLLGLAPLGMLAPHVYGAASARPMASPQPGGVGRRVLILIELKGGNDGLNMLVPFADPAYHALRPRLGLKREQVLPLTEQLGLNAALQGLHPAWQAGELALALGVGYPEPNRSHFRSIEIWDTASDSDEFLQQGWVAQVLAGAPQRPALMAEGVILGNGAELGPLAGPLNTVAINDPQSFIRQARRVPAAGAAAPTAALAHILAVQAEIKTAEQTLAERLAQPAAFRATFPSGAFGRQLQTAAQLIAARVPLAVLKLTLGSFDTHSNQRQQQDRLLKELGEGLAALRAALRETGQWPDVLVMTYSEFGRRVAENGSQGTDHGTAAPHLLLGGSVRGGLYGEQPSLTQLSAGDLVHKLDYRCLYSTIASGWWGLPLTTAHGHHWRPLDCLRA